METYWCTEKNDIRNLNIPIALTPCCKSECDRWRDGKCGHIDIRGYPDRPQVFSKEVTWYLKSRHPGMRRTCIGNTWRDILRPPLLTSFGIKTPLCLIIRRADPRVPPEIKPHENWFCQTLSGASTDLFPVENWHYLPTKIEYELLKIDGVRKDLYLFSLWNSI